VPFVFSKDRSVVVQVFLANPSRFNTNLLSVNNRLAPVKARALPFLEATVGSASASFGVYFCWHLKFEL